jgi:hypothetical protein
MMPNLMMGVSFIELIYYIYLPFANGVIAKVYMFPLVLQYTWILITLILNSMTAGAYGGRLSGSDSAFKGAASTALFFPIISIGLIALTYS